MAAVTLAQIKAHLRIDSADEDDYLTALVAQAQSASEDFCRVTFTDPAPGPVQLAILLYAGYYHSNREGGEINALKAMMTAFHSLLWPHRDVTKMI